TRTIRIKYMNSTNTSRTAHLLELMKKGDDAFNSRDVAAMNTAYHPDIIAHVMGSLIRLELYRPAWASSGRSCAGDALGRCGISRCCAGVSAETPGAAAGLDGCCQAGK